MKLSPLRKNSGVTLVELVIYIAIFMAVATVLTTIMILAVRIQNRETAGAEITQNMDFVLQNIQRYVQESSLIDMPAGVATSTLTLRPKTSSTDPILIFADAVNTGIYLKQGIGATSSLTTDRIRVGNFSVIKYENPGGHAVIQVEITLNFNTSTAPKFSDVSRALRTAIGRVSAATFDSDLVPNATNLFNVGQSANKWRDGFFTGSVNFASSGIWNSSGNVGIATTTPSEKLEVAGNIKISGTGNALKFPDGTSQTTAGGGTPGGAVGAVQFVSSTGIFGGDAANFFWDNTNKRLGIGNSTPAGLLHVSSSALYVSSTTGNVGIGTTGPSRKLHINGGDIRIDGSADPMVRLQSNVGANNEWALVAGSDNTFRLDRPGVLAALSVISTGNVGIGTATPGAQLDLSTDSARKLTTTTWLTGSDRRIKTNVMSIDDALGIISRVRPIKFRYTADFLAAHPSVKDTNYYNFIAQEYQEVFPDSVTETDGLLYLNSSNMIPYAIAGIKELDLKVALQSEQIKALKAEIEILKAK